jgi:TonB family protein
MPRSPRDRDVFSAGEIAAASGVPVRRVRAMMASGAIRTVDGRFARELDARRAVRLLREESAADLAPKPLFCAPDARRQRRGIPLAVSSTLHAAFFAAAVFLTTVGLSSTEPFERVPDDAEPLRLVYLALPGPGGGGGGGGARQPRPAPPAERKGTERMSSPIPARQEPEIAAPESQPIQEPAPLEAEPLPPIAAPVATVPSDSRDRIGALEETQATADSKGPGTGGGVGTGQGVGIGEGDGSGIGPGSGGGTGGGPYRPGSGIEPPRLLREVKPDYTEEARRRGVEGDVVMEIVVRRDGSVGDVRILQSLGFGLDRLAADAVRQWRFAPARRLGTPVDVLVEVAVEFKLR